MKSEVLNIPYLTIQRQSIRLNQQEPANLQGLKSSITMNKESKKCIHGRIALFCCACNYGERSWQKSKKGMGAEKDTVDFMEQNKSMRMAT